MKFTLILVIIALFASYGVSAMGIDPVPCCHPNKFECVALGYDYEATERDFSRLTFDYELEGFRVDMKIHVQDRNFTGKFTSLNLFNEHSTYLIDWDKNHCKKIPLSGHMERWCVPQDAHFAGAFTIGGEMKAQAWWTTWKDNHGREEFWEDTFAVDHCVPISSARGEKEHDGSIRMHHNQYFNVESYVDAKRLIVPNICHNAVFESADQDDNLAKVTQQIIKDFHFDN